MFNMAKEIINVLKQTELLGRQFSVYGTAEEPLFLAKEVASIIGHTNPSKMLEMVDEDERVKKFGVIELTNGYKPCESVTYNGANYLFGTEGGLYELLMQSRTEQAKMFKSGVKEILKTIRKTGGYIATTEEDSPEEIMAKTTKKQVISWIYKKFTYLCSATLLYTYLVCGFLCPQIYYRLKYKQRFLRAYLPTSQYESVATLRNSLLFLFTNL